MALGLVPGALAATSSVTVDLSTSVAAAPIVLAMPGCNLPPPPSMLGPGPENYTYGQTNFTAGAAGDYAVEVTALSAPADAAVLLYTGASAFSDASPATNLLACDNNNGLFMPAGPRLVATLSAGASYTIVAILPKDPMVASGSVTADLGFGVEPTITFADKSVALGASGESMTATSNSAGVIGYSPQDPAVALVDIGTGAITTVAAGSTLVAAIQAAETGAGTYGTGVSIKTLTVTSGASACSSAFTQAGYSVSGCGAGTASGTSCTASCGAGYTGTAIGSVSCSNGSYSGTFSGCTPAACSGAYTLTGYAVTNCGAGTASGTSCAATCASGYTGTVSGAVSCSFGSYSGAFSGCTVATYNITTAASPPAGGTVSCTPGNPVNHGSNVTCTATASPGYTFDTFSGDCTGATCSFTNLTAAKSVTATFTANPCAAAFTQTGYAVTSCGAGTASGTSCAATCASGYTGTAAGSVSCSLGAYSGTFSGCTPAPATSVTAVTISASPLTPSTAATMTAAFTPTTALVAGDTITVKLTGYTFTAGAVTVTAGTGITGPLTGSVSVGALDTVVVTLGTGASATAGTSATLTFLATNPAAGTIAAAGLTVATSKDTTAVASSADITIAAASCSSAYSQTGYAVTSCGAGTASGTSCSASCAAGYTGSVAGTVSCSNGSYTGTFSGCSLAPCPAAYTQTGYSVTGCGAGTAAGASCAATCAAGYTGTVAGTVSCNASGLGTYVGTFSGCSPAPATSVTAVTVSASPVTPSTAATMTVVFTPTTALAAGDTITVKLTGYTFIAGATTVTAGTGITGPLTGNVSVGALDTVVVTLGTGASATAGTSATLTFPATNPAAGTIAAAGLTVATSKDTTAVASSANIVIAAAPSPSISGVTFSVSPATANSSATMTVGFTQNNAALVTGNTINVSLTDFVLPATIAVARGSGFDTGVTFTASSVGNVVTITLGGTGGLAAGTAGTLTFQVTNPAAKTVSKFGLTVRTTQVTTAVAASADVVINTPPPPPDYCASSPCQNGGTCTNGPTSAICSCTAGFTGSVCQTPPPTAVTEVTISASPLTASTAATLTVSFRATTALSAGDVITVNITDFSFAGALVVTPGSGFTGSSLTGVAYANNLIVDLGAGTSVAAGTLAQFTVPVTNPPAKTIAKAGLTVRTSKDTTAVASSADIVIAAASLSGVTFSVSPATANSSATMTVGFTQNNAALVTGNTINVGFTDFVLPATIAVSRGSGFDTGVTFTAASAGNGLTITLGGTGGLAAGTAGTFTFQVTNPAAKTVAKAGLTVATTQVTTAVAASADIVITQPVATKLGFTQQPAGAAEGKAFTTQAKVAIQDASGATVTTARDSVTLAIKANTGASGAVLQTCGPVDAVGGVATFTGCAIDKVGTGYILTATSATTTLTAAESTAFDVTQARELSFYRPPQFVTVNTDFSLTVQPKLGSAIVTSETVPITLTSVPAFVTAPAAVNANNGSAAFSALRIATAGTAVITASATGYASVSTTVTVQAAAAGTATKVSFLQQPSGAVAGTAFATPPIVAIQDASGVVVATGAASAQTVTLALRSGTSGATLSNCTSSTSGGVASFSGCTIDRSGIGYVLTASSGTLTSADSAPFAVCSANGRPSGNACICNTGYLGATCEVGAVARLEFSAAPSYETSNVILSTSPVLKAVDSAGSTVTTATGSVALTLKKADGTTAAVLTPTASTAVALSSGVATFSNLKVTGVDTGLYLEASMGSLVARSPTFCVYADAAAAATANVVGRCAGQPVSPTAAKLAFVINPGGAVKNTAFTTQPKVEIQDASGAKVSSTASVALSIKSGNVATTDASTNGVCSAPFITCPTGTPIAGACRLTLTQCNVAETATLTCPAVNAVAGVATFAGCKIDKAGTDFILTASSGSLAAADSGTFSVAEASVACQPGTYGTGGTAPCRACAVGKYQPEVGSTSCLPSPAGSFVRTSGQAQATPCPVGTYNAFTGQSSCTTCPTGLVSNAARTECVAPSLAFLTQPGSATPGAALSAQPAVSVGPVGGTVTLAIKAGTGEASATLTCANNPVTTTSTTAVFSGCSIDLLGTNYVLTATSSAGGSTDSQTFNIENADLSSLSITPGGDLSPVFFFGVREYTAPDRLPAPPNGQVTISATPATASATVQFFNAGNDPMSPLNAASALTTSLTTTLPATSKLAAVVTNPSGAKGTYFVNVRQVDPPGAPGTVSVDPGSDRAVVTWLPPADTGGATAESLEYSVVTSPAAGSCSASAGVTSCSVTGLTLGATYTFSVKARNSAGEGPASTSASVRLVGVAPNKPGTPRVVDLLQDNLKVRVEWDAAGAGQDPDDFQVLVSAGADRNVACTVRFNGRGGERTHGCEVTLDAAANREFFVKARNAAGSTNSDFYTFSGGTLQPKCGTAVETVTTVKPTTNLCVVGTASDPYFKPPGCSPNQVYQWTCSRGGGSSVTCTQPTPPSSAGKGVIKACASNPYSPPPRRPPAKKK